MNPHIERLIWYSALIILMAWAGGIIPLKYRKNKYLIHLFISFGAGVLLGAAFLHMIPDAAKYIGANLGLPLLFGFLTLYILEKFVMIHPCPAETCEYHKVGLAAFIGLSVHSLITGMALGAGILVPHLGIVVFLAVALHKLPASLSLSSLLVKENYTTKKILLIILLFSLMVPTGAILTYIFIQHASTIVLGNLVAFAGGTFLHVSADDLLPEVHHQGLDRKARLFVFLSGLVVIWSVTLLD